MIYEPVNPKTVVFRYFSWPAKSTKVSTFELLLQISVQSNDEPWDGVFTTWNHGYPWILLCLGFTCPFESKPRISFPTDDVLPVSISCLWRNNFCLAWPRPLSKQLCVSTPNNVDFPASTLPTTAILTSQKSASASNRLRIKKSLVSLPPSSSFVRRRVNEQSNFEATFSNEATTLSHSSADKP